jgi:hypothetical protein
LHRNKGIDDNYYPDSKDIYLCFDMLHVALMTYRSACSPEPVGGGTAIEARVAEAVSFEKISSHQSKHRVRGYINDYQLKFSITSLQIFQSSLAKS